MKYLLEIIVKIIISYVRRWFYKKQINSIEKEVDKIELESKRENEKYDSMYSNFNAQYEEYKRQQLRKSSEDLSSDNAASEQDDSIKKSSD